MGTEAIGGATRRIDDDLGEAMRDLLLPETDAGVLAQVVTAAVAYAVLGVAVRRNRELVWFVSGLATLTLGFFALRTVH